MGAIEYLLSRNYCRDGRSPGGTIDRRRHRQGVSSAMSGQRIQVRMGQQMLGQRWRAAVLLGHRSSS
eukprot:scaffold172673_cov38-Prasinocladus_malaysianus.AAC.1